MFRLIRQRPEEKSAGNSVWNEAEEACRPRRLSRLVPGKGVGRDWGADKTRRTKKNKGLSISRWRAVPAYSWHVSHDLSPPFRSPIPSTPKDFQSLLFIAAREGTWNIENAAKQRNSDVIRPRRRDAYVLEKLFTAIRSSPRVADALEISVAFASTGNRNDSWYFPRGTPVFFREILILPVDPVARSSARHGSPIRRTIPRVYSPINIPRILWIHGIFWRASYHTINGQPGSTFQMSPYYPPLKRYVFALGILYPIAVYSKLPIFSRKI